MYLTIKFIHIISATLLFGTGLGSAFYMLMAYRSKNLQAMAVTSRLVVLADYIFTTPTVVIQLLSGLYLLNYLQQPWISPWSLSVFALYAFVGACWLPVVWLQISLRNRACELLASNVQQVDEKYKRQMRWWLVLGMLAFPVVILLYAMMVFRPLWS